MFILTNMQKEGLTNNTIDAGGKNGAREDDKLFLRGLMSESI